MEIPLSCCNRSADTLIEWFGPEEIKVVVGGERWWQVRGMDSIDGEWITERQYLSNAKAPSGTKLSQDELDIIRMEALETVMVGLQLFYRGNAANYCQFYVHGGESSRMSSLSHRLSACALSQGDIILARSVRRS